MSDTAKDRRQMIRQRVLLGLGVIFNFLLPWGLYRLSVPRLGEAYAIIFSAAAPAVWSLFQFVRRRKADVMSVIVLSGIGLTLLPLAFGGSPKLLLFRESLVTGLGGLVLFGSALIRRPLLFVMIMPVVRAAMSGQSAMATVLPAGVVARALGQWESFADKPWFRRVMTMMTAFTGLVLVAETTVRGVLIFSQPTERVLLLAPLIQYGASGVILLWTFLYFVPAVRRGADGNQPPALS